MQGLQNLGSTCAINSLIQIICRTSYLRKCILNANPPNGSLCIELKEILDMMYNKNHSLCPRKFVRHLYEHFEGVFIQGEQLDIGELWVFLFDKINSEIAVVSDDKKLYYHNINIYNDTNNINKHLYSDIILMKKCAETMTLINDKKTSEWLQTSQGILLNIIECKKCNNKLYNFEPFTSISLAFDDTENIQSITSMFRNYLKHQDCKGDWKCEKCNEETEYTKSLKIWKLPQVLVFVIQRFLNFQKRIQILLILIIIFVLRQVLLFQILTKIINMIVLQLLCIMEVFMVVIIQLCVIMNRTLYYMMI